MFDYIYEWLRNLTTYTLLVAVVMQLIPNEDYRKYIRFFCGMVLIVMLISPLFQLVGIQEEFEQIYQSKEYERIVRELEEAGNMAWEVTDDGDGKVEAENDGMDAE